MVLNISKNFNTFIFEANPFLCNTIYRIVDHLKKHTKLINFNIYCPVIVRDYYSRDCYKFLTFFILRRDFQGL